MPTLSPPPDSLADVPRKAADSPGIEGLGRLGHAARGVVYLVLGFLAVRVAQGGGERADQAGALEEVRGAPAGTALLWLLAAGFLGYALWRLAEAAGGRRDEHDPRRRAAQRAQSAFEGLLWAAMAAATVALLLHGQGGRRDGEVSLTARLLELPYGRWLVGLVGAVTTVLAAVMAVRALRGDFTGELRRERLSERGLRALVALGAVGRAARAFLIGLVGLFLVRAAWEYDPRQARGLDRSLHALAAETYGVVLLYLAAAGLVALAVYSLLEVRYRRM